MADPVFDFATVEFLNTWTYSAGSPGGPVDGCMAIVRLHSRASGDQVLPLFTQSHRQLTARDRVHHEGQDRILAREGEGPGRSGPRNGTARGEELQGRHLQRGSLRRRDAGSAGRQSHLLPDLPL